jgi:hypothetical protein
MPRGQLHAPSIAAGGGPPSQALWSRSAAARQALADQHGVPGFDHQVGRSNEAFLYAIAPAGQSLPPAYVTWICMSSGRPGEASLDLTGVDEAAAFAVIVEQSIEAAESHCPHLLDVHHGRHLQHVIEATEIDLISGV